MSRSCRVLVRTICFAIPAGAVVGCAPPTVMYRPLAAAIAASSGQALDLQLTNGERYVIAGADVRNDTLFALRVGAGEGPQANVAVPASRIASLSLREGGVTSGGAGFLGLGIGVALGALLFVIVVFGSAR